MISSIEHPSPVPQKRVSQPTNLVVIIVLYFTATIIFHKVNKTSTENSITTAVTQKLELLS